MFGIGTPWAFLFQHPGIGLLVFGVVSVTVILALSGGRLTDSIGGMIRVFVTFFTTPFLFLRNGLAIMRGSSVEDQDYANSRVFMLFRFNRIQYLGLLVVALLMLSGGITTSILMLYPRAEIEAGRMLDAQISQAQLELATAQREAGSAASPGHRQLLEQRRNEARVAYDDLVRANQQFLQNTTFSGPVISRIASANSVNSLERTRNDIDAYMQGCPYGYNWQGMTPESCTQFRAFALELAARRISELQARDAAVEADQAWQNADSAAAAATARVQAVQANLAALIQQRGSVSLVNAIGARLTASLLSLLGTFIAVIVVIWLTAGLIEFFNWAILLMRAAELDASARLAEARSQREAQSDPYSPGVQD